jgi:hypothetical protein
VLCRFSDWTRCLQARHGDLLRGYLTEPDQSKPPKRFAEGAGKCIRGISGNKQGSLARAPGGGGNQQTATAQLSHPWLT